MVRVFSDPSLTPRISDKMGLDPRSGRQMHHYEHIYHRYLAPMALQRCGGGTIRMLEIGLGCGWYANHDFAVTGNHSGAGGSAGRWPALFPQSLLNFDYHMMEYDQKCVREWAKTFPGQASKVKLHTGDQNSTSDLKRVYSASGGVPFDIVIDDGSHINEHQERTMHTFLSRGWIAPGGVYIIEVQLCSCHRPHSPC